VRISAFAADDEGQAGWAPPALTRLCRGVALAWKQPVGEWFLDEWLSLDPPPRPDGTVDPG
jgi:hypothetical protein